MDKEPQDIDKKGEMERLFQEIPKNPSRTLSLGIAGQSAETKYLRNLASLPESTQKYGFSFTPKVIGTKGKIRIGTRSRVIEVRDPKKFIAYVEEMAEDESSLELIGKLMERLGSSFTSFGINILQEELDYDPIKPHIRPEDKKTFLGLEGIAEKTPYAEKAKIIIGILKELPDDVAAQALAYVGYAWSDLDRCLNQFTKSPLRSRICFIKKQKKIIYESYPEQIRKRVKPWFEKFHPFMASSSAAKIYEQMERAYYWALEGALDKIEETKNPVEDIRKEVMNFIKEELWEILQGPNE